MVRAEGPELSCSRTEAAAVSLLSFSIHQLIHIQIPHWRWVFAVVKMMIRTLKVYVRVLRMLRDLMLLLIPASRSSTHWEAQVMAPVTDVGDYGIPSLGLRLAHLELLQPFGESTSGRLSHSFSLSPSHIPSLLPSQINEPDP